MAPRRDRLLSLIALERAVRAVVLLVVGGVLVTHTHTDWASHARSFAHSVGLDTSSQGVQRVLRKLHLLGPSQIRAYGIVALLYGVLEGVEAWGLWNDRPWAEYLTVLATALLFVPEVWELARAATVGKGAALVLNAVVVAYLVRRLRAKRAG